ncbi:MAG: hypothetical protein P4M11_03020 [Candidatus Pacebacteria bacterium]|nr:hypothetical protein [Candidatus Paceibacterota bacterium]
MLIHQLLRPKVADPRCHQQSLVLCRYRWVLKFKVDVSGPEPTLTLRGSFVGDLFVTLRSHSFCIWTKVPGKVFENIHCCYDATECPVPAKSSCVVHGPANLDAQISPGLSMMLARE